MKEQTGNQRSIFKQKIPIYIEKIVNQKQFYTDLFKRRRQDFQKQALDQIQLHFKKATEQFQKNCKKFQKELVTLKFYQQNKQNHNLYPLFNQIDQKWAFNTNLIEETNMKVNLPYPSPYDLDDQVTKNKLSIYQNFVSQLLLVLKSQTVRKYCKKETEIVQKIEKTYGTLLQKVRQTIYTTEVKIKRLFQEAILELPNYKHVQKMTLCLIAPKGILNPNNYHQLVNSLLTNRGFLKELNLFIMDMEFSQQKSDIIRKRLSNELKTLKNVNIQNYYKECKLGNFEDFNWYPYRKKVNIKAGVW